MATNDITVLQEQADGSLKETLVTTSGRDLLLAATALDQRQALDLAAGFPNIASFPATGELLKSYLALNTRKTYIWSGTAYVETSPNTHTRNGAGNINVGETALASPLLSGGGNSALGDLALRFNQTGVNNSAVGFNALRDNVGGSNNSAFGTGALLNNIAGGNSALGADALTANTTGANNVAVGLSALANNLEGSGNSAFGTGALLANTTGASNTAVGNDAFITGASNSNSSAFGASAQVTGSNQVQLGNSATTVYAYGAVQDRSDVRDKTDVRDTALGLEFINALRPVDFKWDMREDYRTPPPTFPAPDASKEELAAYAEAQAAWSESARLANLEHDGTHKRTRYHHGLIAQEVKAVLEDSNVDFGGFQDHSIKGGDDVLSIGYVELIAPLIKAIQELKAEIETLKANA
jgi:hypothetical protein